MRRDRLERPPLPHASLRSSTKVAPNDPTWCIVFDMALTGAWGFDDPTNPGPPFRGASVDTAGNRVGPTAIGEPHTISGRGTVNLPDRWTPAQPRCESDRPPSRSPAALEISRERTLSLMPAVPAPRLPWPTPHRRQGHRSTIPCTTMDPACDRKDPVSVGMPVGDGETVNAGLRRTDSENRR